MLDSIATLAGAFCFLDIVLAGGLSRRLRPLVEPQRTTTTTNNQASSGSRQPLNSDLPTFSQTAVPPSAAALGADNTEGPKVDHVNTTPSTAGSGVERCSAPINLKALESVADCGLSILASEPESESLVEEDNGNDTNPEDPENVADCGQSDLTLAPTSKPLNGADCGKGSTTGVERGSAHVKTEDLEDVADCGPSNLTPAPASEPFIGEDNGRVSSMEVGRCPGTAPATSESIGDVADCGSPFLRPALDPEPFFGEGSSEGSTMGVERRGCSAPANIEAFRGVADCGPLTLEPMPASEPFYGEGNGMGNATLVVPSSSGAPSLDADERGGAKVASAIPGPSGDGESQAAVVEEEERERPSWFTSTHPDDWDNPLSVTTLHMVMEDALAKADRAREAEEVPGVDEAERAACLSFLQGHLSRNDFGGQWARSCFGEGAPEVRIIKRLGSGGFGTVFLAERLKPLPPKQTTHVSDAKGDDNGEGEDEDEDDSDDDNGGAVLREGNPSKRRDTGDTDLNEAHTPIKCVLKVSPNGVHNNQWATESVSLEMLRGSPEVIGLRGVDWNGGFLFTLLDYAECGDLWDLAHKRVFTDGERFALATNIVKGVDKAHRRGLVHKDIKPENVLVTSGVPADGKIPEGGNLVAKLADFGLAVVGANPGDVLPRAHWWGGTPGYMAPELVAHQECISAIDIWALGPTFLLLFQSEDIHEILRQEYEKVGGGTTGKGNGNGNGNNNGPDDIEGRGKAHDPKGKGKARDDQSAGDDIKDDDAPQEGRDIEDIRRGLRDFVAQRAAAGPSPDWFRGDAWDTPVGDFFRDLIYRVCDPDPSARPTASFLASYIPRGVAFTRPPPSLSPSPSSSSVASPAQSSSRVDSPSPSTLVPSASPSVSSASAISATPAPEPANATPTPPPATATANATATVHASDTTIASATASPPPTSTSLSSSPRPANPPPSPASPAHPVTPPSPWPSPPASPATPVAPPPSRVATVASPASSVAASEVASPVATTGSPVTNADATPTSSTASAPATSTAQAPAPPPTTPPTPAPGSPTPRAPVVAQALPAEVVAALAEANATAAALANANANAAKANAAAAHANAVAAEANAAAAKANAEAEAANVAAAAALAVANAANAAAANAIAAAANAATRAAAPVPIPEVVVLAPPDSPTGTAPSSNAPTRLSLGPSAASSATKDTSPRHSATPAATPTTRAQHSVCKAATHPRLPPSRPAALRPNTLPRADRFANPSPRLPLNPRQGRLPRLVLPRQLNLAVYAGAPANASAEAVVNTLNSANASAGTTNATETGTEPPVVGSATPNVPGKQLALSPRTTTSTRGESQDDDLGHPTQGQGTTGSCEQEQPISSPPQSQPPTPRGEDEDEDDGQDALATTLEGEAITGTGGRRRLTWRRGSKMAARVKGIIRRSTVKARSGNVSTGNGQGSDGNDVGTATARTTAAVGSGQAIGTATTGMAPGSATTATPATPKATRSRPWQRLSAVATRLRGPRAR